MDVTYLNAFISATSQLFETMIKVPLKLGAPSLKRADDRLFKLYKLSATIDVSGTVAGQVVISFSQPVACTLAGALAGRPFDSVDAELLDALGEIANMIAGGAKTGMPEASGVRISTPKVMATHQVEYTPGVPVILLPFDTAAGRFVIEMSLRKSAVATQAA